MHEHSMFKERKNTIIGDNRKVIMSINNRKALEEFERIRVGLMYMAKVLPSAAL